MKAKVAYKLFIIACLSAVFITTQSACRRVAKGKLAGEPLKVLCTTGIIADVAKKIGGNTVEVSALMGTGVDPHLYKVAQNDLNKLSQAHIIIANGLHLEGKMVEVLQKIARTRTVIALGDSLPAKNLLEITEEGGITTTDPHIWFDVELWLQACLEIKKAYQKADPDNKALYEKNYQQLSIELTELHNYVKNELAKIPASQRVLITAHDAFGYYGRAYNIEVRGLQGISTLADFGLADLRNLVQFIIQRKVKAIFVESSISPRAIEAVIVGAKAKKWPLKLGGELFADALGDENSNADSYVKMIERNTQTIAKGLQ